MATKAAQEIPQDVKVNVAPSAQADLKLAALSAADYRTYNRMADTMELFHNNFRRTWDQIYSACSTSSVPQVSATKLLALCSSFISHLTMHHNIEEAHIFPLLGQRMDVFKADAETGPLEQHRQIHAGLDKLQEYLDECKTGERNLKRQEIKDILDGFGAVLWTHLAEEVEHLGAENMRKYWSKAEVASMPM